jgi:hypothetical protein
MDILNPRGNMKQVRMFSQDSIHTHETIAEARFALLQRVSSRQGIKVSRVPFGYSAKLKDGNEISTLTVEGIVLNMLPYIDNSQDSCRM